MHGVVAIEPSMYACSRSQLTEAVASGFVVIETGEKTREENSERIYQTYCGYKGDFKGHKSLGLGFYKVERLEYLRRHGVFQLILCSKHLRQDIGI
jgi:hypothetical protein